MRSHEIENWALRIIDAVKVGHRVEDSRVELKSEWPVDIDKAARRIAGHANASNGVPILWLVGVDEIKGITGATPIDTANWYSQIASKFDGFPPRLIDINVPIDGKIVVALLFETERLPFVVKNPAYGIVRGDSVALEVPWREGTQVRSAKRDDLIRLLSPLQSLPDIEILEASLSYGEREGQYYFDLSATLYIVTKGNVSVVIPFYRCSTSVVMSGDYNIDFSSLRLSPPYSFGMGSDSRNLSKTIESTPDEILIHGPGKLFLRASAVLVPFEFSLTGNCQASIILAPVLSEHPIPLTFALEPDLQKEPHSKAAWKLGVGT